MTATPLIARSLEEQSHEKCETIFYPELRKNERLERFSVSMKS